MKILKRNITLGKLFFVLFLSILSFFAIQVSSTHKASALSATYPDNSVMNPPSGHDGYVEVSRVGGGNSLNAPNTTVDIFFKTGGRKNITIIDGKSCGGADWQESAADGSDTTHFELRDLYYVDLGNEDDTTPVGSSDNSGSCSNHSITFTNVRTDAIPYGPLGPQNWFMGNSDAGKYYGIRIIAKSQPVGGMVNAFKVHGENCNNPPACTNTDTDGVFATTPASNKQGGADHFFALQCRPGFDCPQTDFHLDFGATCDPSLLGTRAPITWYDDDWNTLEAGNNNYNLRLLSIPKSSSDWSNARSEELSSDGSIRDGFPSTDRYGDYVYSNSDGGSLGPRQDPGGWYKIQTRNDGSGDTGWAFFTPDMGRKYRLVFNNVSGDNGLRFILPWNPMFSLGPCSNVGASCTATASATTVALNGSVNVNLTVKNTGNNQWPSSITVTGTGGHDHNPGQLNPGQTASYTDTFTRSNPQTLVITYKVLDGGTVIATCNDTVTWGNGGGGNQPDGWCIVLGTNNANPIIGQNVIITTRFANTSVTRDSSGNITGAGNDWILDTNSQHSGVLENTGEDHRLNRIENPGSIRDRLPAQLRAPNDYWTDRSYTVNSGTIGTATYTFKIRKDNTGSTVATCTGTINWRAPTTFRTVNCHTIDVNNPGEADYGLKVVNNSDGTTIFDSKAGSATIPAFPAPFKDPNPPNPFGPPWDPFNQFNGELYPHNSYTFTIFNWNNTSQVYDSKVLGQCMTVSCSLKIDPAAIVEPTEKFTAHYGLVLTNKTLKTFSSGTYGAQLSTGEGLSGGGESPDQAFAAGTATLDTTTSFLGPYTITANYTGTMSVDFLFQGNATNGAFAGLPCHSDYTPQTRPYLSVTQGDISAGGGFANSSGVCTSANYVAPDPRDSTTWAVGGIRTFANTNGSPTYGSHSDFAAYALGLIDGNQSASNKYGFYSDINNGTYKDFDFANTTTNIVTPDGNYATFSPWGVLGGLLDGTNMQAHCAPDYFDKKDPNLTLRTIGNINLGSNVKDSGQYYYKAPNGQDCLRISGTVPTGARITIYTPGNVCIDNNVTYGSWNFDLASHTNNAPYLVVVAKGDIYVKSNVSQMSGLYVAQPGGPAGSSGAFYTCSPNGGTLLPSATDVRAECKTNSLTVSGAVIAQHVYPLRSNNTLISGPAVETFDFTPSTIVGQPNLLPNNVNPVDQLNSRPPVF